MMPEYQIENNGSRIDNKLELWTELLHNIREEDQLRRWHFSKQTEPEYFEKSAPDEVKASVLELELDYSAWMTLDEMIIFDKIHSSLLANFIVENKGWPDDATYGRTFVNKVFTIAIHTPQLGLQKLFLEKASLVASNCRNFELLKNRVAKRLASLD